MTTTRRNRLRPRIGAPPGVACFLSSPDHAGRPFVRTLSATRCGPLPGQQLRPVSQVSRTLCDRCTTRAFARRRRTRVRELSRERDRRPAYRPLRRGSPVRVARRDISDHSGFVGRTFPAEPPEDVPLKSRPLRFAVMAEQDTSTPTRGGPSCAAWTTRCVPWTSHAGPLRRREGNDRGTEAWRRFGRCEPADARRRRRSRMRTQVRLLMRSVGERLPGRPRSAF